MSASLMIVDPTPAYRRGLGSALTDAGYEVTEAPGFTGWGGPKTADVIVVTVRTPDDIAAIAKATAAQPSVRVVALVDDHSVERVADILRSGGNAVAERDAPLDLVANAVRIALDGYTLVPQWAADAFVARIPARPSQDAWIRDDELQWLRLLGHGTTVATLARDVGYSEREMFRNLHDLYARIRVRNRTEALLWAERHGLLGADSTQEPTRPADG